MDNQQVTPLELGWLVGAIDGEGALGITKRNRKHATLGFTLKPHVQLCNCDKSFIDRYTSILDKLSVPYHITFYKSKGRRREHWTVTTAGLKRVSKILPSITELLCDEKREKAILMQEYIDSRLADWHAAPFTERQLEIVEVLSGLNTRGRKTDLNLRDYTRDSRSSKFPNWKLNND